MPEFKFADAAPAGICPKCNDDTSLTYGNHEIIFEQLYYEWTCKCGASGREVYDLTYSGMDIDDE